MKTKRAFKSQLVGFYFAINDLKAIQDVCEDAYEAAYEAASQINHLAYTKLDNALPNLSLWNVPDLCDPEMMVQALEVCEESIDEEVVGQHLGFSFWLYTERPLALASILVLKEAVIKGYAEAAAELSGSVAFLKIDSQVTEEVVTTETIYSDLPNTSDGQ